MPPWYSARAPRLGEQRCARIGLAGNTAPPGLCRRPRPASAPAATCCRAPKESARGRRASARRTGRSCPDPTPAGRRSGVSRARTEGGARAALGGARARVPARRARSGRRLGRPRRRERRRAPPLNERRLRRAAFPGPRHRPDGRAAPELAVGAADLRDRRTASSTAEPADGGGLHDARPERADGQSSATKPLVFEDGVVVRGLRVRFEGGRAVEIDADAGAENLRLAAKTDEGASGSARSRSSTARAGSARSAPSSTTRCSTRTRPATSRSATRSRSLADEEDLARVNKSGIHIDFMIGGDDVDVTGDHGGAASACPCCAAAHGRSRGRRLGQSPPVEAPDRRHDRRDAACSIGINFDIPAYRCVPCELSPWPRDTCRVSSTVADDSRTGPVTAEGSSRLRRGVSSDAHHEVGPRAPSRTLRRPRRAQHAELARKSGLRGRPGIDREVLGVGFGISS